MRRLRDSCSGAWPCLPLAQSESSGHPSCKFPTYQSLLQLKNQADCSRPPAPPTMNTVVFNKFNSQVLFEENAKERESNSRPYLGVIDSPHHPEVHIPDSPSIKDNLSLRNRRTGARQSGGKVRHKRQALQDMARPLKQWLYKHRDNPYPTKTEKILLALGSQMTLVQVSNWFANARRRLKNTVRQPDLSWALRIKLYNKYVQGNAERLSVSSDDSCSEDGENPPRNHINEGGYNKPVHHTVIKTENSVIKTGVRPETSANEDYVSPPKYKSSLLNRYLNDSLRHVMATNAAMMEKTRQRNHSGSFSSNEFEEELVSPSSSETEGNFVYRTDVCKREKQLTPFPLLTCMFHSVTLILKMLVNTHETRVSQTNERPCTRGGKRNS
ncbi:homeobox protein Mohawk isoform X2 [Mauremys mutica]|uniref:homeobox protein Mohawk isoform X2 n=1 Tax=Mauremys mutica TaxID=74926 RepID=UPI001D163831|nr:homeobox protein Mohawk isoform X2 [Mauremys mutica]